MLVYKLVVLTSVPTCVSPLGKSPIFPKNVGSEGAKNNDLISPVQLAHPRRPRPHRLPPLHRTHLRRPDADFI
jgi:hypothetical protein